jgi:hypothetical protein
VSTVPLAQHRTPCAQCPFRRTAANGWLGGLEPEEFKRLADSEARMPCHSQLPEGLSYHAPTEAEAAAAQCAGRAIYWANQFKRPRDPSLLTLPADRETVFQWQHEFVAHHERSVGTAAQSVPQNVHPSLKRKGIRA